jgi:hypothetical protein
VNRPLATIVVVPRERFSVTRRALEALYASTNGAFPVVYVDAGSPPPIKRYLAAEARSRGFGLVRIESYLAPNQARNIGLRQVKTRYVIFIDNDAVPAPGSLDRLVQCAEETGAWVVGPIYFVGEPGREEIHMAGGDARVEEHPDGRHFVERHRHVGRRAAEIREHLVRAPCEQVEFHCMLVRTEVFGEQRVGPLDESLLSLAEHTDLCLLVRKRGGEVFFEPDATVTYITTGPFGLSDYAFFFRRWSEAWNEVSIEHFREKWGVSSTDPGIVELWHFSREHRHYPLVPIQRALIRAFGFRVGRWLGRRMEAFETRVNRRWVNVDRVSRRRERPSRPVAHSEARHAYLQTNIQLYRSPCSAMRCTTFRRRLVRAKSAFVYLP